MKKEKKLTPREEKFCLLIEDMDKPETYHNLTKTYIAAGYKQSNRVRSAASELGQKRTIQERREEIRQEILGKTGISPSYVLLGIMHNEQQLREAGDYKGAEACLVDLGRSIALFSDRRIISGVSPEPEQLMSNEERSALVEAVRTYKLRLSKGGGPPLKMARPLGNIALETLND